MGTEEAYVSLHLPGSVETRHKWELARAKLGGGRGRRFFYIKKKKLKECVVRLKIRHLGKVVVCNFSYTQ